MFELFRTVGNNRENRAEDIFSIKETLNDFGFFDFDSNPSEPHGIFTRELDEGIKGFQKENDLRVDGILNPKGETETTLRQKLVAERPKPKRPKDVFIFAPEKSPEFDATGRRIRESERSVFEPMTLSAKDYRLKAFDEESIKKQLQERQVKLAATPEKERKNTESEFKGLKPNKEAILKKLMEDQEKKHKPIPVPSEKPSLSVGERKALILDQKKKGVFHVVSNPNVDDSKPWFAVEEYSEVKVNEDMINKEAKKAGVNPDLVKAIVHLESTHGYYDNYVPFDLNKTIRPMNIHSEFWKDLGYSRDDLKKPKKNIQAGVKLLKRIQDRMPGASVEKVASVYNSLDARYVTDYGARVGKLMKDKPWKKKDEQN